MTDRGTRVVDVNTIFSKSSRSLPPIPNQHPLTERTGSLKDDGVENDDADPLDRRQLTLTRAKEGDTEQVYFNAGHGGLGFGMKKSKEAMRLPDHVYTYLVACMPAHLGHSIDDGVLTSKPSSSQQDCVRVDVYNTTQEKADANLSRLNVLCGSIIDSLNTVPLGARITSKHLDAIEELTNHFKCAIMRKANHAKLVCKSCQVEEITRWLENRIGERIHDQGESITADDTNDIPIPARGSGFRVNGKCHVYPQVNDITKLRVDVIVNPANGKLNNRGDLSSRIANFGGPVFIVACHNHVLKHGPVSASKVVCTQPGNLTCRCVLHAVLPPGPGDVRSKKKPDKCEKGIEKMFKSVLKNLDKKKTRDAAMPLMALEINGIKSTVVVSRLVKALTVYKWRHHSADSPLKLYVVDNSEIYINVLIKLLEKESEKQTNKKKKSRVERL
ncbi:hypothetical protein LSH36_833g00006 [Paralvinella palmiformis]|uniref:Macro domain-containing protein n=1 Tax=Paralvinella palmiformis TaxID=53620 RepID=A0AAD9MUK4_9ANNE|nr:hypothetical protein LSH36_833g00006 [Paralvinella palmiformis]